MRDEVRAAWEQEYAPYLPEVCALDGARLLLERLHEHGCTLVLASSGKPDHIEHYLDLPDARRFADTWTTAQDAEQTKPAPDLLTAALERVEVRGSVVTVGDSTWDVLASRELGYDTHCVLSGGFSAAELERAGAVGVHEDLHALWAALSRGQPVGRAWSRAGADPSGSATHASPARVVSDRRRSRHVRSEGLTRETRGRHRSGPRSRP